MNTRTRACCLPMALLLLAGCGAGTSAQDESDEHTVSQALAGDHHGHGGDIHQVKHVIIVMQENHSFDNYFGALAYAPGSPYHSPRGHRDDDGGGCQQNDHDCVDGLSCRVDHYGDFRCDNSNPDTDAFTVHSFHDSRRCVAPDLDHSWLGTHQEVDFLRPNDALRHGQNDGFVRVNDVTEQPDNGVESPTEDQTMGFYNQSEIPFYYALAETFALSDRYFASVL